LDSDPDDRKFTTIYTVFLKKNPVAWASNKKNVVSRSTSKAEYRSIATTLTEIKWTHNLLHELRIPFSIPKIYSDNLGAIFLAANPIMHLKTKQFDIDLHFVRDAIQHKEVHLIHIPDTL